MEGFDDLDDISVEEIVNESCEQEKESEFELQDIVAEGKALDLRLKALKERSSALLQSVWEDNEQLNRIVHMLPECLAYYRYRIYSVLISRGYIKEEDARG